MMKRIAILLAVAIGIVLLSTVFLFFTARGLEVSIRLADRLLPGKFSVQAAEGKLAGHFTLAGVRYAEPAAMVSIDHFSLAWRPGQLLNRILFISSLEVGGFSMDIAEGAEQEQDGSAFALPFAVRLVKARVTSVSIAQAAEEKPLLIDSISIDDALVDDDQLWVASAAVIAPDFHIKVDGLQPVDASRTSLSIIYSFSMDDFYSIAGVGEISGSLAEMKFSTSLEKPFPGTLRGTLSDPAGNLDWQGELAVEKAMLSGIGMEWPEVALSRFKARGSGTAESYEVEAAADIAYDDYKEVHVNTLINGDAAGLNFSETRLSLMEASLAGEGRLDWSDDFTWQARVHGEEIDLSAVHPDWPAILLPQISVAGKGILDGYSLEGEGKAGYQDFEQVVFATTVNGDASGLRIADARFAVGPGTLSGDGRLDWSDAFAWQTRIQGEGITLSDLRPDWPEVVFNRFAVYGQGLEDSYNLEAEGEAGFQEFQAVPFAVVMNGGAQSLRIADARLVFGEGTLSAEGRLEWSDVFAWQAELAGKDMDPSVLDERWPGRLDLLITSAGRLEEGSMQAAIDLLSLDGELRGYPLSGKGVMAIDGSSYTLDSLLLQTTASRLHASGRYDEKIDIGFDLQSTDLAALWPGAAGTLLSRGHVRGQADRPVLVFELFGKDISLDDMAITALTAGGQAEMSPAGLLEARLSLSGASAAGRSLDTLTAELSGTFNEHLLRIEVSDPAGEAAVELAGGVDEHQWTGRITGADIRSEDIGHWQLAEPAGLLLSGQAVVLENSCLSGKGAALLCLAGSYEGEEWQGRGSIAALPLSILQRGQQKFAVMEGELNGSFFVNGKGAGVTSGELDLSADQASMLLILPDESRHQLQWTENRLRAELHDQQLTADLSSLLEDGSSLSAAVSLNDFAGLAPADLSRAALEANLDLRIKDLHSFRSLSYPAMDPSGSLQAAFTLRGTPARPLVSGQAELLRGKMILPLQGITLEELAMTVTGEGRDLHLRLNGVSGGGQLEAEGTLSLAVDEYGRMQFTVNGDMFEIINVPDLQIFASPDLEITIERQQGEIQGQILIPRARIESQGFGGSVSPSGDVVIVDDQAGAGGDWPLYVTVTIIAGDDVRLNASGLKGKVEGKLRITSLPDKPVTAEGALNIRQGTFAIYGRELTIVTGRLLFSGGPVDNPGIDVRAESTAAGITTGIQVSGFLQEPEVTFYSSPPMEQDEIIARLLMNTSLVGESGGDEDFLGSITSDSDLESIASAVRKVKETLHVEDVKIEAGRTSEDLALVIGTWLTPKLYISYGKNLLKESGMFNTRYILGRGFSIQTETGSTQSGIDLKYEINR